MIQFLTNRFCQSQINVFILTFLLCIIFTNTRASEPIDSISNSKLNISKTMSKSALKSFVTLEGISAASGLVFYDQNLYIIGDNSGFLSKYNLTTKQTTQIPLIDKPTINIAKKVKPDFESISLVGNQIHVFGSGSTENRQNRVSYDLKSHAVETKSMKKRYERFQAAAELNNNEFNIEGTFSDEKFQYYCQRGNKSENKNCLFRYDKHTEEVEVFYFKLPKINGISATFTDAVLVDRNMYFVASAENSNSTYHDGEIMGSLFGSMNIDTMKIQHTEEIGAKNKFEGITLFQESDRELKFLLCEDNDNDRNESEIFELTFKK